MESLLKLCQSKEHKPEPWPCQEYWDLWSSDYEEMAIKNGMLIESVRTEGLGFSLAHSDIYLTNLINKYEANLLY